VSHTGQLIPDLENVAGRITKRPAREAEPRMAIAFYVAPAVHERIEKTAIECGTTISAFCRTALTSYLDGLEEESDMERDLR
jgi:hypothetical protein